MGESWGPSINYRALWTDSTFPMKRRQNAVRLMKIQKQSKGVKCTHNHCQSLVYWWSTLNLARLAKPDKLWTREAFRGLEMWKSSEKALKTVNAVRFQTELLRCYFCVARVCRNDIACVSVIVTHVITLTWAGVSSLGRMSSEKLSETNLHLCV